MIYYSNSDKIKCRENNPIMLTLEPREAYTEDQEGLTDRRVERLKRKSRLTNSEREKYIRRHTTRQCDVTGEQLMKRQGNVHHIKPVMGLGDKNITNLSYIEERTHQQIHALARRISRSTGRCEAEVVQELTNGAMELGKLGRVMQGEDPEIVYKRELKIERERGLRQSSIFDHLEG